MAVHEMGRKSKYLFEGISRYSGRNSFYIPYGMERELGFAVEIRIIRGIIVSEKEPGKSVDADSRSLSGAQNINNYIEAKLMDQFNFIVQL